MSRVHRKPLTHLQTITLLGQSQNLACGKQIGFDSHLKFLIEPHGGRTVEDNVDFGRQQASVCLTKAESFTFVVTWYDFDLGSEIWYLAV